ncbi:hypothetical protein R5R35_001975 [Gryllus longicercus]|uniref:Protein kinase domain-containing protein n=1 Tax=Gryllus longicercus TaxID=2509291 RepID=A0AAN9Z1U3_9ORTH
MLDLADLEYYCYSGVWNAGLFWREWVQCNDRRHHQKYLKTEKKSEESQEKAKQTRRTWTLTSIGSNIKQKTLRRNNGDIQKLRKFRSCEEQQVGTDMEDVSLLPIPILPESGLHVPADHSTFPCGTFTEIMNAEFFHSPIIVKREKTCCNRGSSILRKELRVLSQIHHPNILLLMGFVKIDINDIVTVFEDASNGTLHHLLHQKKTILPPTEIQKFLTQLCHVMLFLHQRGWLHTAITSHSIVITANSTLKLTGFEMARKLNVIDDDNSPSEYLNKQWFPWKSPEQLSGVTILSPETDIFSVGVISWEMCTNAEPWFGYTQDEIVTKYKSLHCALESDGLPSSFVHTKNEGFIFCMQQMLKIDPKKRISCFLDVLSLVHKLQALPISTPNLVSEHIQPIHLIGSLERTQLLFQPRPQKATLTTSEQYDKHERDPYTGLKRVPNSWQKLNGKAPSTTSLDIVNLHSPTSINRGNKIISTQKFTKQCVNKFQEKNHYHLENNKPCDNSTQNNTIQKTQIGSQFINKRIKGNFEISQLSEERKNFILPTQKLLFPSQLENSFSRAVPIKPASHLNQRAINFRSISTKLNYEQNIQHEVNLRQKENTTSEKGRKWETSVPIKLHQDLQIEQESLDQKAGSTKAIETKNNSTCSKYSTTENRKHYRILRNPKLENRQHSEYLHKQDSNGYQYSEETDCQSQKGHDICNSDTESKDNGFESTDSGIFTISREFDQNLLNQMNSTEDLYIDDEFCLEMELDSHMQLLGLFDSNSDFIDSIHSDLTENENLK